SRGKSPSGRLIFACETRLASRFCVDVLQVGKRTMRSVENTAVNELIARANDEPMLGTAHSALPATMPVAAPFEDRGEGAAQAWAAGLDGSMAESPPWSRATAPAGGGPASPRRLYELMSRSDRERMVPTFQIRRRSALREVVGRLVLPISVLVSTGV